MTKSSSTSRSILLALMAVFLCAPIQAFAAVKITDILSDPAGADQGREWIRISNTGTEPVDMTGYKLFESGTNHKLTVVQGTTSIPAGATAMLTTDPEQYKSEHQGYTGTLFKSSFSLSNTGETIELKDALLKVVDTYSYTAPVVVKTAPVKLAKTPKSAPSVQAKTTYVRATDVPAVSQAAALPLATLPPLSNAWTYGLALAGLLILGAGAAFYARPRGQGFATTSGRGGEFELE